ncbi:MAG: hypothetical protein J6C38_01395 [Oscillospiraceae bacterium]|nr:hypothetical protein [Oscillospiraceae bacterium]
MKRQIISAIAAVAVIVAALTGCSENKENSSQSTTTSSSTTSSESSSTTTETKESSSSTAESSVSTSESAPESTSEPASESKTEVSKKTITLVDVDDNYHFGDIEVPLDNNGVNKYLQKLYDKKIIPEGTYAGTEILLKEDGSGACIIFSGNSVNHGNVPVYDFGFTTDWEPTPIEEDDKIWEEVIVPDKDRYVEKNQKGEIKFVDLNKNGTAQNWEVGVHSILSSETFELRGIIYL